MIHHRAPVAKLCVASMFVLLAQCSSPTRKPFNTNTDSTSEVSDLANGLNLVTEVLGPIASQNVFSIPHDYESSSNLLPDDSALTVIWDELNWKETGQLEYASVMITVEDAPARDYVKIEMCDPESGSCMLSEQSAVRFIGNSHIFHPPVIKSFQLRASACYEAVLDGTSQEICSKQQSSHLFRASSATHRPKDARDILHSIYRTRAEIYQICLSSFANMAAKNDLNNTLADIGQYLRTQADDLVDLDIYPVVTLLMSLKTIRKTCIQYVDSTTRNLNRLINHEIQKLQNPDADEP